MKANEIIDVLINFEDSRYQKILIDGNWGIGKTKYILDFKEGKENICYISLFGKRNIESILEEIYVYITEKKELRKKTRNVVKKFNDMNIRYRGIPISLPFIKDLQTVIQKDLGKNKTIIIFDDLERKHDDLDIKELFGLIDSISKIDVKIVVVAAKDKIEQNEIFFQYQEKAIDRSYKIEKYADEAPINIFGAEKWDVISKVANKFNFENLRTFEKMNLFIEEVNQILGESVFSEKFTKRDLYRMCFAIVIFNIEHKSELRFLNNEKDNFDFKKSFYKEEKNRTEYLSYYILNNSFDNHLCRRMVFPYLVKWYETGDYCKEKILTTISEINNYEKKPSNFYLSMEDIQKSINNSLEFLKNLIGNESLELIGNEIISIYSWSERLDIDLDVNNEEILGLVRKNISNTIKIKELRYNEVFFWYDWDEVGNENAQIIMKSINEELKHEYFKQLFDQIKDNYVSDSYINDFYLLEFMSRIHEIDNDTTKEYIISTLEIENYLFPVPNGKISESKWTWCNHINNLINKIDRYWGIQDYKNKFIDYIYNIEKVNQDKMAMYRLKLLFEKQ